MENKISIITGAARGIGKATAILFGEEGSTVVVADIDMEGTRKAADEMREKECKAFPVKVHYLLSGIYKVRFQI